MKPLEFILQPETRNKVNITLNELYNQYNRSGLFSKIRPDITTYKRTNITMSHSISDISFILLCESWYRNDFGYIRYMPLQYQWIQWNLRTIPDDEYVHIRVGDTFISVYQTDPDSWNYAEFGLRFSYNPNHKDGPSYPINIY